MAAGWSVWFLVLYAILAVKESFGSIAEWNSIKFHLVSTWPEQPLYIHVSSYFKHYTIHDRILWSSFSLLLSLFGLHDKQVSQLLQMLRQCHVCVVLATYPHYQQLPHNRDFYIGDLLSMLALTNMPSCGWYCHSQLVFQVTANQIMHLFPLARFFLHE